MTWPARRQASPTAPAPAFLATADGLCSVKGDMADLIREVHVHESAVRLVRYAPFEIQGPHWHDRSTIAVLLRGGLSETDLRETEEASALSVVFKPARTPHADRIGEHGATVLQIELGRADEAIARTEGALRGWRWEHAMETAHLMLGLATPMLLTSTGNARRDTARCFHTVLRQLVAGDRRPRPAPQSWLTAATPRLECRGPAIREVAVDARVHPVYFARAFRRCFGESPVGYRQRHRFREAVALLTDTCEPLADVALSAGFADQSHMTRDLVRRTGLTPRALRLLANAV